jgi:hypothetical protein
VLGNGHAGFGRRPEETHRWQHRQGASGRPHRGERLIHTQAAPSARPPPRRRAVGTATRRTGIHSAQAHARNSGSLTSSLRVHVVALAGDALDECRRRVQLDTRGHRGRKTDPLYRARRTLAPGPICSPTNRKPGCRHYSPSTPTSRSKPPGTSTNRWSAPTANPTAPRAAP